MADITDETFQAEVIDRSNTVPVVVDLWAPWCGPCKTLGPILEKVIGETQGLVELAKIDVDENPGVSQAFQVQSIPAVYAMYGGQVVDGFMGAKGEPDVVELVQRLLNLTTDAVTTVDGDTTDGEEPVSVDAPAAEAITPDAVISAPPGEMQAEIPVAPSASEADAIVGELDELLVSVKGDDDARARYLELLDQLGAEDQRTNDYRRKLASALF